MTTLIYLATPYTSYDPDHEKAFAVQRERYLKARAAQIELLSVGTHVYSPIVACHYLTGILGHTFQDWQAYNYNLIDRCDELWVLRLPGWDNSVGVLAEIHYALEHNKPVSYLNAKTFKLDK